MTEKDYIIASIRPFVMNQEVSVYLNGNCFKTINCTIDDIEKTISTLANEYNIKHIDLIEKAGMYSTKIKDRLITQYADKNFDISIW